MGSIGKRWVHFIGSTEMIVVFIYAEKVVTTLFISCDGVSGA